MHCIAESTWRAALGLVDQWGQFPSAAGTPDVATQPNPEHLLAVWRVAIELTFRDEDAATALAQRLGEDRAPAHPLAGDETADAGDSAAEDEVRSADPVVWQTAGHPAAGPSSAVAGTAAVAGLAREAPGAGTAPEAAVAEASAVPAAHFGEVPGPDVRPAGRAEVPSQGHPAEVAAAVTRWGADRTGIVGLVHVEALPESVVDGLLQRLVNAIGEVTGATGEADRQLGELLTPAWLHQQLAVLRSEAGVPVPMTQDGRPYTVWLRLTLTAPVPSRQPAELAASEANPAAASVPEQHLSGVAEYNSTARSGNYRSLPIAFSPSWPLNWSHALDIVGFYPSLSLTHNELSTSAAAGGALGHVTTVRSREGSQAFDFRLDWQFKVDAPWDHQGRYANWADAGVPGEARVVMPDHLTRTNPDGAWPAPATSLDEVPLYAVDGLAEPQRLLAEIRTRFASELAGLSGTSWSQLGDFTGERELRSNMALMRADGYISPTLFDTSGNPVGLLRLRAELSGFHPIGLSEETVLEQTVIRGVRREGSHAVTNHVGVSLPVGFTLSADPGVGHPNDMLHLSSALTPRVGGSLAQTRILDSGSSATVAHTLTSSRPHLLAWADVRYSVTLIMPEQRPQTADFGPWNRGALLRVPTAETVAAAPAAPDRQRYLPLGGRGLDYLDTSVTPGDVTGTDDLFDEFETWLTDNHFLPPTARPDRWALPVVSQVRALWDHELHVAQLENYGRLAVARSQLSIGSNVPEMNAGGHLVSFSIPGRQVDMLIFAEPTDDPTYLRRLSGVHSAGFTSVATAGAESLTRTTQESAGFVGTIAGPLRLPAGGTAQPAGLIYGSLAPVDVSGTMTQASNQATGHGTEHEQGLRYEAVDVFRVPLRLTLGLYEGGSREPTVRFGGRGIPGHHGAAGALTLFVPAHLTTGEPAPAAAVEQPSVRLAGSTPLPEGVRVPSGAHVGALAGSKHLIEAFEDIVAGRYDDHATASDGSWLTGALSGASAWAWQGVLGADVPVAGSLARQAGRLALSPTALIANAHQMLNGTYDAEHIVAPGLIADKNFSIELEAALVDLRPLAAQGVAATGESAVTSSETRSTGRATVGDAGAGLSAAASAVFSTTRAIVPQARYGLSRQAERTRTDGGSTSAARLLTEEAPRFGFRATVLYRLTVRRGVGNLVTGALGIGRKPDVTVFVRVPDGAELVVTERDLGDLRDRLKPEDRGRLSAVSEASDTEVGLPERYIASEGAVGLGAVMSAERQQGARRFGELVSDLVERHTPGVLSPGDGAYVPGLRSRLSDLAGPAGMRALAGRAGGGATGLTLHYVYLHATGARLAEVTVAAEPAPGNLGEIRGRIRSASRERPGRLTNRTARAGATTRETRARGTAHALSIAPAGDHPGNPAATFNNKTGFAASYSLGATASGTRESTGPAERTLLSTGNTAEFVVPYSYTVRVRLTDLDGTWLTGWLNRIGPAVLSLLRWQSPLGGVLHSAETRADVTLAFAASDATRPADAGRLMAGIRKSDPLTQTEATAAAPEEHGTPVRAEPSPEPSTLHGDFTIEDFTATGQLLSALREAAPEAFTSGGQLWDSPAGAHATLTEIFRAGSGRVDIVRGRARLAADDAAGVAAERAATLLITLSGPRSLGPADGVGMTLVRGSASHESAQAEVSSGSSFGATENFNTGPFIHSGDGVALAHTRGGSDDAPPTSALSRHDFPAAGTQPARQRVFRPGAAFSRNNDAVGDLPGSARTGSSWKVSADVVIRVRGTNGAQRWVTGTVYLRMLTDDILGHGLITTEA
ncbi:MAG TPA: hypothetical protein VIZ43_13095, partial [Trebonia sp.]